jgi:hypothetical protein
MGLMAFIKGRHDLHPNAKGYAIMGRLAEAAVVKGLR